MRMSIPSVLTATAAIAVGQTASGQVKTVQVTNTVVQHTAAMTVTHTIAVGPGLPTYADVVVVGRVTEIEPAVIEVAPFKGARPEQMVKYKVANIKIDDPLVGAGGITRVRVGFPADGSLAPGGRFAVTATVAATAGTRVGDGPFVPGGFGLTAGQEGCFQLAKHPNADFYVLQGLPVRKTDPDFAKRVDRLKRYGRAVADPVAALKAKDLDERFEAAQLLLARYRTPRGSTLREPLPDDENKLIVGLLKELPWLPAGGNRVRADGRLAPHREVLWYAINPGELGFRRPEPPKRQPGDPPVDYAKLMDEATTRFLAESGDKIKLKRFVEK